MERLSNCQGTHQKKSELTAKNDWNEQENPKTGSVWAVFSFKGCFKISDWRMLEVKFAKWIRSERGF